MMRLVQYARPITGGENLNSRSSRLVRQSVLKLYPLFPPRLHSMLETAGGCKVQCTSQVSIPNGWAAMRLLACICSSLPNKSDDASLPRCWTHMRVRRNMCGRCDASCESTNISQPAAIPFSCSTYIPKYSACCDCEVISMGGMVLGMLLCQGTACSILFSFIF